MSIAIATEYPGASTVPSAAYPQGSFKNDSVPGVSADGTPFELVWPNDLQGLTQRLLLLSGIAPSNVADTALVSDYVDAMEALFVGKEITFIVANGPGDPVNDIDFSAGFAKDPITGRVGRAAASIIKQGDAAWVEGDAVGGRADAVVFAPGDTGHMFRLWKADGVTCDAGFDTDVTGANLITSAAVVAAGYVHRRRVCSLIFTASGWQAMVQDPSGVTLDVPTVDQADTQLPLASTGTVLSVPLGLRLRPKTTIGLRAGPAGALTSYVVFTNTGMTDTAPTVAAHDVFIANSGAGSTQLNYEVQIPVEADATLNVRGSAQISTEPRYSITTRGWIDLRDE